MNEHRYTLEPYKGMNTRYRCPYCQQRDKTFSRYIDAETGEHIHPTVGKCERINSCGIHYTPKQYFQDNNISFDTPQPKAYRPRPIAPPPKPVSFIPIEAFKASLNTKAFEKNNFVKYLIDLFGGEVAGQLVSRYFIANSKHWSGATVFWQIDIQGKVRTGKIMLYSPTTGKRVKEPCSHIQWVHSLLKQPEYSLKQCFFGEHLLIDKTKPVAIVESEKTAIIASGYLPDFAWLAVGGKDGLNTEKCSILKGRSVVLYPDLGMFEKWSSKAKELSHLAKFAVSDLLERKATEDEKTKGLDLADYLSKFDYRKFTLPDSEPAKTPPAVHPLTKAKAFDQPDTDTHLIALKAWKHETAQSWEKDIAELEKYFVAIELPTQPVKLNPWSTIEDCSLFVESSFETVKRNNGTQIFLPYLDRLKELKKILNESCN